MGLKRKLRKLTFEMFTSDYKDWKFTEFYAIHKPTSIHWWHANGFISFSTEGTHKIKIGFWYLLKLWRWLKLAQLMQAIKYENLNNNTDKENIFKKWEELQCN